MRHFLRLCSIVILICILLSVGLVLRKYFPIKVVKLKGSYRYISEATLTKHLLSSLPRSMFFSNIVTLRDHLEKIDWIESVQIDRIWPDTLVIFFKTHKPIALWCDGGSVLNTKGVRMRAILKQPIVSLVRLCGPEGTERLMWDRYHAFQKVLKAMHLEIARLTLSDRCAWTLDLRNHWQIQLGREHCLERLQRLLNHQTILDKAQGFEARIDLRYPSGAALSIVSMGSI